MSLLHDVGRKLEKVVSWIPHTTASEKRTAMQAAKQQIDYYKTAKEDLLTQRTENENQKKEERQRINEKEIRARQRQYRRGGFMAAPSVTPTDTLG